MRFKPWTRPSLLLASLPRNGAGNVWASKGSGRYLPDPCALGTLRSRGRHVLPPQCGEGQQRVRDLCCATGAWGVASEHGCGPLKTSQWGGPKRSLQGAIREMLLDPAGRPRRLAGRWICRGARARLRSPGAPDRISRTALRTGPRAPPAAAGPQGPARWRPSQSSSAGRPRLRR